MLPLVTGASLVLLDALQVDAARLRPGEVGRAWNVSGVLPGALPVFVRGVALQTPEGWRLARTLSDVRRRPAASTEPARWPVLPDPRVRDSAQPVDVSGALFASVPGCEIGPNVITCASYAVHVRVSQNGASVAPEG